MIVVLLNMAIGTILCGGIDAIRIRWRWGKVENISKPVSLLIFAIMMAAMYFLHPFRISWLPATMFAIGCPSIRFLLFAPSLNLFRGKLLEYISSKTNSKVDGRIQSFWMQRAIGAAGIVIYLVLNIFL